MERRTWNVEARRLGEPGIQLPAGGRFKCLARRSNVERRTWNVEARPGEPGSGGCAAV